jgi:hypothetical protein
LISRYTLEKNVLWLGKVIESVSYKIFSLKHIGTVTFFSIFPDAHFSLIYKAYRICKIKNAMERNYFVMCD